MKKFLAVYIGTETARAESQWDKLDAAERQAREARGMHAWMDWGIAHSEAIVDQGAPLGKTKRASKAGIADAKNSIVGYVLVEAESHDAAARMFVNHPHFSTFPGDSVEIMECLPLPERT